jgi:hypothetical protein
MVYFTPLHAACVERNGNAVLLCGESGAGKSCLAYACARRGWTLIADDAVHLAPWPDCLVAGGSRVIRLREVARALFPELEGRPMGVAPNGKPALEIAMETNGFRTARFATPSQVVFLARGSGAARSSPYSADAALGYFLQYMWHRDIAVHARRLRRFLARGAHELRFDHPDDGVDALEKLTS